MEHDEGLAGDEPFVLVVLAHFYDSATADGQELPDVGVGLIRHAGDHTAPPTPAHINKNGPEYSGPFHVPDNNSACNLAGLFD